MKKEEIAHFIGDRIKYYRKQNNWTQAELGKKIGIGKNAVGNYERGFRSPKKDTMFELAKVFDIPVDKLFPKIEKSPSQDSDELITAINDKVVQLTIPRKKNVLRFASDELEAQENTVEEPTPTYYTYNYYDQPASAGTGQYLNDVQVEQIELPMNVNADFVVPIYGDSMEPEYHSGDYIFVKLSVNLSDGDIGVFEYHGEAYIKQLLINENGAFLHSLNTSEYDDIPIDADSDFRIIGEVVDVYREG